MGPDGLCLLQMSRGAFFGPGDLEVHGHGGPVPRERDEMDECCEVYSYRKIQRSFQPILCMHFLKLRSKSVSGRIPKSTSLSSSLHAAGVNEGGSQ